MTWLARTPVKGPQFPSNRPAPPSLRICCALRIYCPAGFQFSRLQDSGGSVPVALNRSVRQVSAALM